MPFLVLLIILAALYMPAGGVWLWGKPKAKPAGVKPAGGKGKTLPGSKDQATSSGADPLAGTPWDSKPADVPSVDAIRAAVEALALAQAPASRPAPSTFGYNPDAAAVVWACTPLAAKQRFVTTYNRANDTRVSISAARLVAGAAFEIFPLMFGAFAVAAAAGEL